MRLKPREKSVLNAGLSDLCRHRHPHIPMGDICRILGGCELTIEDMILCGRDGRAVIELRKGGVPVDNADLILSWYKGEYDGRYETVAYVS